MGQETLNESLNDESQAESLREPRVEDFRVHLLSEVSSPRKINSEYPATGESLRTVALGRASIRATLHAEPSSKLLVVVGPCSIHDPEAAMEYATWLKGQREQYGDRLEIVMRAYFEKPRTTVGWKGLINDPHLDESYDIALGLRVARQLLVRITHLGVPVGGELLGPIATQYFDVLMSCGSIGARTAQSPQHRELASGVSFPVGFKNNTEGNTRVAVDGIIAASYPHSFLGITKDGKVAAVVTDGNPDCHIILRGGSSKTNYDAESVALATQELQQAGFAPHVMVDFSHANSHKDFTQQMVVAEDVANQIRRGSRSIMGVMIESNLEEGSQPFKPGGKHTRGKSITDGCVGLAETKRMLDLLYEAREGYWDN